MLVFRLNKARIKRIFICISLFFSVRENEAIDHGGVLFVSLTSLAFAFMWFEIERRRPPNVNVNINGNVENVRSNIAYIHKISRTNIHKKKDRINIIPLRDGRSIIMVNYIYINHI